MHRSKATEMVTVNQQNGPKGQTKIWSETGGHIRQLLAWLFEAKAWTRSILLICLYISFNLYRNINYFPRIAFTLLFQKWEVIIAYVDFLSFSQNQSQFKKTTNLASHREKGIYLPEYFEGVKFNLIITTGILNNKALENICN